MKFRSHGVTDTTTDCFRFVLVDPGSDLRLASYLFILFFPATRELQIASARRVLSSARASIVRYTCARSWVQRKWISKVRFKRFELNYRENRNL